MKELSIEQKAKTYDNAFNVALETYQTQPMYRDWLEKMFPELKESEDERLRKELIVHCRNIRCVTEEGAEKIAKWITWLERQGDHANFRNKIQIGDKVTRNRDGVLVNLSQLNRVAKVDEKQGEQNPNYNNKELKDIVIAELSKYNSNDLNAPWATDSTGLQYPLYFANLGAKWQEEQKPAWSEEDATHYNRILKELNLQKEMPINASVIEEVKSDIIWFKSLRPQNRWKPSDEQMEAINTAINVIGKGTLNGKQLIELQEQLKKLREELL